MERFNATLMKIVPEVVGLILFFGVAYFSYMTLIWTKSPFLQLFFLAILLTTTIIRVLSISSHILFSPTVLQFRILPIQCPSANLIYRLIVWTGSYMTIALMITIIVHRLGAEINTVISLRLLFATLLLAATAASVLIYKNRITETLLNKADDSISWGRRKFISLWHILVLVYLFILWLLLINTIDSSEQMLSKGAFILSFLVIPIWLIADQLVQWIVKYSMSTLKIYEEDSLPVNASDEEYDQYEIGQSYYIRLKSYSRIVVVIALLIWIASLWGINIPFFSKLTSVLFNASIILALALIFWQFTSSWIERKIQMAIPEEKEENEDDEWGSAASRGRSYTLLPMVRKFIGTVLVIMVTMTILSSMGVDIGPLLAGAGVVGLAIGFGAQKLVSDMFSGFFYLLDDAFRVGEYLEAGSVSGTVEKITLRNILLRHHRGMLQIVPHSELGAITNFMRGGIVVKFNLDFPYDADIDLIRRVIKKVGQAMLEDEEFGKDFIKPVKSQGVREITNSVMTIRVKFTAQPGSHFVIRREAYKRITEALSAKKIPYAHKKVIVDLPADNGDTPNKDTVKAAGAAALQAAEPTEPLNTSGQGNESGAFD